MPPNHQTEDHRVSNSSPSKQVPLPQHFLVRPGTTKHTASGTAMIPGPIVPLIPIDQLPEWLDVVGIPRDLTVEQTMGLCNLGTVARSSDYYDVHLLNDVRLMTAASPYHGSEDLNSHTSGRNTGLSSSHINPSSSSSRIDLSARAFTIGNANTNSNKKNNSNNGKADNTHVYPIRKINDNDPHSTSCGANSPSSKTSSTITHSKPQGFDSNPKPLSKTKPIKDHRPTTINANDQTPIVPLNPRLPSPPASSTVPSNPYPLLWPHHGPHPASCFLSTSASPFPSSTSSPLPSSSTATTGYYPKHLHHRGGSYNNSTSNIFCRHWCHYGTCKWGPVCRYQHAMPQTVEGLREVGLSDFPGWWLAAMRMSYETGHMGWVMYGGLGSSYWSPRKRWEGIIGWTNTGYGDGGERRAGERRAMACSGGSEIKGEEGRTDGVDDSLERELHENVATGDQTKDMEEENRTEREKLVDI
ncbi:uncharacterized protein BCR38DRAFT_486447 [Pseudomassariella vexata]|uniref:C3H1-type domain-containing protein n=1 Tax=Pseudomassariella vexata TaxID=1141098 RepID=A0A1Y2DSD1_9PEZI|nr:uncharacterized protein BCR38DRAFT_486447 [Pseudomassariella vexata]ORY62177.1 hypothetical protein BCR38DRAFT_486447 [Pseudomassariella vexata]